MALAAAGRRLPLPHTSASAPVPQHSCCICASSQAPGCELPAIPTPSVSRIDALAAWMTAPGRSSNRVATTWSAKAAMASIAPPATLASKTSHHHLQRQPSPAQEGCSQPWRAALVGLFECINLLCKRERECHVVRPRKQTFLAEGIDLETVRLPIRAEH